LRSLEPRASRGEIDAGFVFPEQTSAKDRAFATALIAAGRKARNLPPLGAKPEPGRAPGDNQKRAPGEEEEADEQEEIEIIDTKTGKPIKRKKGKPGDSDEYPDDEIPQDDEGEPNVDEQEQESCDKPRKAMTPAQFAAAVHAAAKKARGR